MLSLADAGTSRRGRFQFSLRSLFVLTAVVAAYFSMAVSVGYVEASGTLVALLLLVAAWRWHRRGGWILVRIYISIAAAALLWMVAVDWSWFVERCDDCWMDRDVIQVRLYHFPVYETTREHSILPLVAQDLGVVCPHEHSSRWYKVRFWGLIYPALPCINGTVHLSGDYWYDEIASEIVRERVNASPGLAEEFRQRILIGHDQQYVFRLLGELKKAREGRTELMEHSSDAKHSGG